MLRKASWCFRLLTASLVSCLMAGAASAAVIEIFPTIGPNPFGPSFNTYAANALAALQAGGTPPPTGAAGPGMYLGGQTQGPNPPAPNPAVNYVINPSQVTATNSPNTSWLGTPNPGAAFGAPFANELGNFLYYGIRITADQQGETFNLAGVRAANVSTLTTNSPGLGLNPFPSNLNDAYGSYAANNVAGFLNNVPETDPNTTDPVDELYLVGPALAFSTLAPGPNAAAEIGAVLQEILNLQHSGEFVELQFNLNGFTNLQMQSFSANSVVLLDVPEPGSVALWSLAGLGLLGYVRSRRRATA